MGAAEWCVCERFWFFLFFSGGMGREADLDFMSEKWDGGECGEWKCEICESVRANET